MMVEEILMLRQKVDELQKNSSSSSKLERKPFLWDRIIFSLASTIFSLSVTSVVVEFLKSYNNSLACFSELENRAQYTYINSYCQKYLPVTEYFSVALVLHAAALLVPHYLWTVFFSAQFDSFFSHAAKVETLLEENTGKYPRKNYIITDHLQREFGDRSEILTAYITKSIIQILLVLIAIAVNLAVFPDINSDITFECYDNDDRSQIVNFGNVTCAYPKKLLINVLQVADYILLVVAMVVLGFSLRWSLLYNHSAEDEIAQFCYDSSIDAKFYNQSERWFTYRQNKDDFKFLLASLLATNSGLRRVFKNVIIEIKNFQKFKNGLESLRLMITRGGLQNSHRYEVVTTLDNLMFNLCEVISEQLGHHDTSRMAAIDIGCHYHSYMFGIAKLYQKVISIIMSHHYKEDFMGGEYHDGVMLLKIPVNLFELPEALIEKFTKEILKFIENPKDVSGATDTKISFLVIGPLDSQPCKDNIVNQVVDMLSRSGKFFTQGAVMLIIKPITVNKVDISQSYYFIDWTPEGSSSFWHPSPLLNARSDWPQQIKSVIDDRVIPNGCVVDVKCGRSNCKFQLKAYQYQSVLSLQDDVI